MWGLGVHFPLLIVAVPVIRLLARVESRPNSWLKMTKFSQVKEGEKGIGALSAELWQLQSVHLLRCSSLDE